MQPAAPPKTKLGLHQILSSTAGVRVSPLCLGGMSLGDAFAAFMGSMSKDQVFALLDEFYSLGGNFLDTANGYQDGQSESWIGDWMTARKNRQNMVVATKYTFNTVNRVKHRGPEWSNHWGNHKRSLRHSLAQSLQRLQTDFIDILYVHWWDYTTSIPELMNSLHALVEQGIVMYLGISDTPAWVVAMANSWAIAHGKTPFSIYQGRWNVIFRDLEREVIPMAMHFGMAIAPWDVLGSGKFQSMEQMSNRKAGDGYQPGLRSKEQSPDEVKVSEALVEVAKEHGIKSVTAIAIAYVRSKAPNVFPIIGGKKLEHLRDNLQSLDVTLTKTQIEYLESVKEFDVGFPGSFIGQDFHLSGSVSAMVLSQGPVKLS